MITALDHFVLVVPEIDPAVAEYSVLLGAPPVWQATGNGVATAVFQLENTAIELMGPDGDGEAADKLKQLSADGARMTSLVYRSDDLIADHHLMTRRGLSPTPLTDGGSVHRTSGEKRSWQRFRVPDASMAGVKTFLIQPESPLAPAHASSGAATSLDHLVINTPNPERTVATYGARLGLRFALDRTAEEWKTRFLFFRLGGLTLEIINRLGVDQDPSGDDEIWGLTWESKDLQATHARLTEAGLDLSEIRTGRKPGSTVFTVRTGAQGIPTLFIAHAPR